MKKRVRALTSDFGRYADTFERANLFTGPSLHFHHKTLSILQRLGSASIALADPDFLDSLYATLTAWGMHRMGRGGPKLLPLPVIRASLREQADSIRTLQNLSIQSIEAELLPGLTRDLWLIIANLRIGVGRTKIVVGSKALHHLLPSLVPPIDREHTLRFFYNNKTLNRGEDHAFAEMYPHFHSIARSCGQTVEARLGMGMNTSVTKTIDNAIVGYSLTHLT